MATIEDPGECLERQPGATGLKGTGREFQGCVSLQGEPGGGLGSGCRDCQAVGRLFLESQQFLVVGLQVQSQRGETRRGHRGGGESDGDRGLVVNAEAERIERGGLEQYAGVEFFVFPTIDEPWGLALNEVMAAGWSDDTFESL